MTKKLRSEDRGHVLEIFYAVENGHLFYAVSVMMFLLRTLIPVVLNS